MERGDAYYLVAMAPCYNIIWVCKSAFWWQQKQGLAYYLAGGKSPILQTDPTLSLALSTERSLETRMTSHISFWDFLLISSTPHSVKLKCHLWAAFAQKLPRIGEWEPYTYKITQLQRTYTYYKVEIGHFGGLLIVHLPTFPTKSSKNSLLNQTF